MSYEIRSHDEIIFECETLKEFNDRLEEVSESVDDYSDLNGSAYLQTHYGIRNELHAEPEWQRIQDERSWLYKNLRTYELSNKLLKGWLILVTVLLFSTQWDKWTNWEPKTVSIKEQRESK